MSENLDPSLLARFPQIQHLNSDGFDMKIASFTMMRNEAAILDPFLDQLQCFFDYSAIVDHQSTDGSVSLVERRSSSSLELFHLKSRGYPQSTLATEMMRRIFQRTSADWLFFLDCDEFLPFNDRGELEEALLQTGEEGYCRLNWANIVPTNLDGGNIFASPFDFAGRLSPFPKIIVSKNLFESHQDLKIAQGYHACLSSKALPQPSELSSKGLYHVPVTSKLRFAIKVRNSGRSVMADKSLVAKGLGYHWINHHLDLSTQHFDSYDFRKVGLYYPGSAPDKTSEVAGRLEFSFPYVKTKYEEKPADLVMLLYKDESAQGKSPSYILTDDSGNIVSSNSAVSDSSPEDGQIGDHISPLDSLSVGEIFSQAVEPLFALPQKLPPTAWAGHIPFLMTLIKSMQPQTYVELGTHYGASLIGAATASKSFNVPMKLYAIDSWEGDEHAGVYEGEPIYRGLKEYTDKNYKNVELIRSYFDDANDRFASNSIDILHIDGLHTYEAVKHDFLTWLPKMVSDGVILFHDTCVHERGFGVYQLWDELKEKFDTLSFSHSFGLGVLFLDASSPRIDALGKIARDKYTSQFYTSLVSQIGSMVHPRMHYLELQQHGRASEQNAWNRLEILSNEFSQVQGRMSELEKSDLDARKSLAVLQEERADLVERVTLLTSRLDAQAKALNDLSIEARFYQQQSKIALK